MANKEQFEYNRKSKKELKQMAKSWSKKEMQEFKQELKKEGYFQNVYLFKNNKLYKKINNKLYSME